MPMYRTACSDGRYIDGVWGEGVDVYSKAEGPSGRSVCFWSWNGDMEPAEVRRQMEEFAQGRFGGVVIHARAGLRIPYMGKEWFAAFRTAVDAAKELGLEIFLYDEDGWPSGFAAGAIPAKGEAFCFKRLVHGYGPEALGEHPLAAYRRQENGGFARLSLDEVREGDLVFGYTVDCHYVDLLYPPAVSCFIERVHEVYAREVGDAFGNPIRAVFTDEPQLNCAGYPWSVILLDLYQETYGESLWDSLWLTVIDGEGYPAFRQKLWRLIAAQYVRSFTRPISDWCEAHGLVMTGHFACEDGLCDQIASCGGVMPNYAQMGLPAIDHLGNRLTTPVLGKQVSSASRQLGDGQALSETFGCSGWNLSFARMAWIWGWQSVLGVTLPCFHLAAYTMEGRRKRDYPAFFSYQEPWWKDFSAFIRWMDRHNARMREGERLCRVLVLSPIESLMREYRDAAGRRERNAEESAGFRLLLENLLDLQIDFEIGDEELLAQAGKVQDGFLQLGAGRYNWVLIPKCDALRDGTWSLLRQLTAAGGHLVFVGSPPAAGRQAFPEAPVVQNRRGTLEKYWQAMGYERDAALYNPRTMTIAGGFVLHVRRVKERLRLHIWNASFDQPRRAVLALPGEWNLFDDEGAPLPSACSGRQTFLPLSLEGGENRVLVAGPRSGVQPLPWKLSRSEALAAREVTLLEKNCLTVDRAAFALGNEKFSQEMPVIRISDLLYAALREKSAETVRLRYRVRCEAAGLEDLTLVLEDRDCLDVRVNGESVQENRIGWWMDRCMGEYALPSGLRAGENIVELTYRTALPANTVKVGEVFETERNRFFYPLEPDAIYIRGRFDVEAAGSVQRLPSFYTIGEAGFSLAPPTVKTEQELTAQGLWFYRGDVQYTFIVEGGDKGERTCLTVSGMRGVLLRWTIGEATGVLFQAPWSVDITPYLQQGENRVTITLTGSNRNLMGPHHHINGEPNFVGPSTFQGRRGFEDFVSPWIRGDDTWTDNYAFVPYELGAVAVRRYREADSLDREAVWNPVW